MTRMPLLLVLAAIAVGAQVHPDLSGTWSYDAARSEAAPRRAASSGPVGPQGNAPSRGGIALYAGRGGGASNQIVIAQTPADITIGQNALSVTYTFDGREIFAPPAGETKAVASWDGPRLVIAWKRTYYTVQGYVDSCGRDVYSRSGDTLTLERTTTTPQGTETRTVVFTKAQN